jgi:hypothetical protein
MSDDQVLRSVIVAISCKIDHYAQLAEKVINRTQCRVIRSEKVDASDKVVSVFESHTDNIKKKTAATPVAATKYV